MVLRVELDTDLYLWLADHGQHAPRLLISSHGSYTNKSRMLSVPNWTSMSFFNDHGTSLNASPKTEISMVIQGQWVPKQVYGPGVQVMNYTLTKFQGKHSGNQQSYADVQAQMIEGNNLTQGEMAQMLDRCTTKCDVLTVRNRGLFGSSVTLHHVMTQLHVRNLHYSEILCLFCRSQGAGAPKQHLRRNLDMADIAYTV